jgi:hypothetical protein
VTATDRQTDITHATVTGYQGARHTNVNFTEIRPTKQFCLKIGPPCNRADTEVHRSPQRPREVHIGAQVDVAERFCRLSEGGPQRSTEVHRGAQYSGPPQDTTLGFVTIEAHRDWFLYN